MILRQLAFYAVTIIATTLRLSAHDYWFEPSRLFAAPGLQVLELERASALITLPPDKFAEYLEEEGRGHLRRAPAGDVAADWESFWAACTFGVK